MLRKRIRRSALVVLSLSVLLVGVPLLWVAAEPNEHETTDAAALQDILDRLQQIDVTLEEAVSGFEAGEISEAELRAEMATLDRMITELLWSLPDIYGIPFADWIWGLGGLKHHFTLAQDYRELGDLEDTLNNLQLAAACKNTLEPKVAESTKPCPNGRALVTVYPGFDRHELTSTISELLLDGYCVTVTGSVPEAYDIGLGLDADLAMETLVYTALGTAFTGRSDVTVDPLAASAGGFDHYEALGEVDFVPHTMGYPLLPHAQYDDSTLASGTRQGEPIDLGDSPALSPDEDAGPWVRAKDVCDPTTIATSVYGPLGDLVEEHENTTDPADAGVDCFSSSSSMNHLNLMDPAYWTTGTYWVEVWVNDVHSATHPFTVVPLQVGPYVYGETYYVQQDTPLAGNVLDNDFDLNGDPLTVSSWGEPPVGEFEHWLDGQFICNPPADFIGVFSITYSVTDGNTDPDTGILTVVVEE